MIINHILNLVQIFYIWSDSNLHLYSFFSTDMIVLFSTVGIGYNNSSSCDEVALV